MQYRYKVSVIVPCYNVENWLDQCLQSLVSQTLKQIEIICVNDGSTDSTKEKLTAWQSKYPTTIKLINQENGGLANARNAGMQIAQGEYMGFVDSDDWVADTMFAKMYQLAIKKQAEVVHCDRYLYNQQTHKKTSKKWQIPQQKLATAKPLKYLQLYANGREGVCFFIFQTKFLQQHNIKFVDKFTSFEDFSFLLQVCLQAENIIHIAEYLYFYRQNHTANRLSKYTNSQAFIFFLVFNYAKQLLNNNSDNKITNHITMVQILSHAYAVKGISFKLLLAYLNQASIDIFSYNSTSNIYQTTWMLTKHKNIIYLPFVALLNILYLLKNTFCQK